MKKDLYTILILLLIMAFPGLFDFAISMYQDFGEYRLEKKIERRIEALGANQNRSPSNQNISPTN